MAYNSARHVADDLKKGQHMSFQPRLQCIVNQVRVVAPDPYTALKKLCRGSHFARGPHAFVTC